MNPDKSVFRSAEARPFSLQRPRRKLLALPLWLLLLGGYGLYAWGTEPTTSRYFEWREGTSNGEKEDDGK